jgi:Protein of unknown function (DUF2752)
MTLTAAPPLARTRLRRVAAPVATIAGLGAATVALHVRDPHVSGSWGYCPSSLLGFYCPGCGGLRAVHDLTNGDLAAAASSNLILVIALPVLVFALGRWLVVRWTGTTRALPSERAVWFATTGVMTVLIAFAILRNLPVGGWLAP